MTEAEARDVILNALVRSKVLDLDRKMHFVRDPKSDVDLAALGIDSMAVINLCVDLEEALRRDVEIEELIEHPSLNSLARHISVSSLQKDA